MEGEEAVKVFDLVRKEGNLPARMEELVPLSFIGAAAVKFYQAKVKLMDQLGMTEAQRKATLADGQDAGEMLLNIEDRIGELIGEPKPPVRGSAGKMAGKERLPEGIDDHRSSTARAIHRNPAAVAAVIKEARENEDIPTKTAVLKQIQLDKVREAQKDKIPDNQRIKTLLGEEEFAEWTSWVRIRTSIKQRLDISDMSSKAKSEITKVITGIRMDIESFLSGGDE